MPPSHRPFLSGAAEIDTEKVVDDVLYALGYQDSCPDSLRKNLIAGVAHYVATGVLSGFTAFEDSITHRKSGYEEAARVLQRHSSDELPAAIGRLEEAQRSLLPKAQLYADLASHTHTLLAQEPSTPYPEPGDFLHATQENLTVFSSEFLANCTNDILMAFSTRQPVVLERIARMFFSLFSGFSAAITDLRSPFADTEAAARFLENSPRRQAFLSSQLLIINVKTACLKLDSGK